MVHHGSCIGPCPLKDYPYYDPIFEYSLPYDGKLWRESISPCTTERHRHSADGLKNPHVPSWNKTVEGIVP